MYSAYHSALKQENLFRLILFCFISFYFIYSVFFILFHCILSREQQRHKVIFSISFCTKTRKLVSFDPFFFFFIYFIFILFYFIFFHYIYFISLYFIFILSYLFYFIFVYFIKRRAEAQSYIQHIILHQSKKTCFV